jgi:Tfp pilus assembly protein PilN
LELTLSSYEKQHLGAPVVKMLFLASADMAQQLSLEGKGILRHAFEVISLTENVVAAKNFKWPKIVLEGRASVLAACGLALAASMPAIRLLDLDIRDTRDRSALISGALRACVLLVVALGVLGLALSFPLFQKNSGLNALDEELKGLNSIVTKVQAKGDQIAVIEDLLDQRIMFSHVIKELYGLIPSDLILSNFSIAADGQMSMEGYSADRDMVDAFQKAMGQAALFKDVKLEYINKRIMPVGEVNYFGITCRMADVHAKTK